MAALVVDGGTRGCSHQEDDQLGRDEWFSLVTVALGFKRIWFFLVCFWEQWRWCNDLKITLGNLAFMGKWGTLMLFIDPV